MTPEDRDALRAEASMRVLAALASNTILPPDVSGLEQENPTRKEIERRQNTQRMRRAMYAASEADALIAELTLREEFDPKIQTVENLVETGLAAGGKILLCKHGMASFENCAKCDEEDAAAKSGTNGAETEKPA